MEKITTFLNSLATGLRDAESTNVCKVIYHTFSIVLLGISTVETVQAILGYQHSTFIIIYGIVGVVISALSIIEAIEDYHYLYICVWLVNMAMLCMSASMNYIVIIGGDVAVIDYGQSLRDAVTTNLGRMMFTIVAVLVALVATFVANLMGEWLTRNRN